MSEPPAPGDNLTANAGAAVTATADDFVMSPPSGVERGMRSTSTGIACVTVQMALTPP
jgi:hypothetical protein